MDPYGRQLNFFQKTFLDIYFLFALVILIATATLVYILRFSYRFLSRNLRKVEKTE